MRLFFLLDQDLVTLLNLDLTVFEWDSDSHLRSCSLNEFTLLFPVIIVIHVVSECAFNRVHLADNLMVLLLDTLHKVVAHGALSLIYLICNQLLVHNVHLLLVFDTALVRL